MACVVNPIAGLSKLGSVGLPMPDLDSAIVAADTGTRFLAGVETGVTLPRAPQLMSVPRYTPAATARRPAASVTAARGGPTGRPD